METQLTNPLPNVDVELRKPSPFNFLRKLCFIVFGVVGIIISIAICFTVIGIIPGVLMFIGSCGMFAMAMDYYKVACPICHKKNYVRKNGEDFKCKRCNQPTIVHWHKR